MKMFIRKYKTPGGNVKDVKLPRCSCAYNPNIGKICHKCGGAVLTFDEIAAE